jgi:hypothetical protein
LTLMNVLLAACVLLVQSGALLVSYNYKMACALQTLEDLELVCMAVHQLRGSDNWPILSQFKTAVHQRPANLFLYNLFYKEFCGICALRSY